MALTRSFAPFLSVISQKKYAMMMFGISALFWIILNVIDQLLFFWPVVTFYLPEEKIISFIISTTTAVMLGVVITLNVNAISNSRKFSRSFLSGSSVGIASCACAGCSSIGMTIASTFGGVGAAAFALFVVYQLPLRMVSLALLAWSFYSILKTLRSNPS